MSEEKRKNEDNILYFRLNPNVNLVWHSSDNTISLSALNATKDGVGVLYGCVNEKESPHAYNEVLRAIQYNVLIKVTKKEYERNKNSKTKINMIDINAGYTDAAGTNLKANSLLLNKDVDELIEEIENIYDPSLLATMIKKEENKQNKDKVIRSKVLDALNRKLNSLKENGMSELVFEGESETIDIDLKNGTLNVKNKKKNNK